MKRLLPLLLSLGVVSAAHAALGDAAASVQTDQMRMQAVRRSSQGLQVQTHELRQADGSVVTEYLSASGTVFAVTWRSRLKPDLELLLGKYFANYQTAAQTQAKAQLGVRRAYEMQVGDLVVQQQSFLNTHSGKAYLRSLTPAGVSADAIR